MIPSSPLDPAAPLMSLEPVPAHARDTAQKPVSYPPKTIGEKWFDGMRFAAGEGIILGLTAVLAYVSKYGKESYGGVPNLFKKMNDGIKEALLKTPVIKNNENGKRIAEAVAGTTTLMHGGNVFVPVMKILQDHKEKIVDDINAHFGQPGELQAGRERLHSQEKESWGDIIKGRLGSWSIVFASLLGADIVAGKEKNTKDYWSDRFKDKFGRVVAGLTKDGKDIAATPLSRRLTEAQRENKAYRYGKILALDIFATTAALAIWTTISKISATTRKKKALVGSTVELIPDVSNSYSDASPSVEGAAIKPTSEASASHTARLKQPLGDYRALAASEPSAHAVTL